MVEFPKVEVIGNKKRIHYWNGVVEYIPKPSYDGSETSLDALNPIFKPKAEELIKKLRKKLPEYQIQVNCTFRSKEEQEQLRKTSKYAAKISPHCFGLAIDISVVDKNGQAVTSKDEIKKVLDKTAEELDIYWGGWFSTIKEPWHFQIALVWENLVGKSR